MSRIFITGMVAFGLLSCQKNRDAWNVDPAFILYVDRFIEAADERGIEVDFEDTGLEIVFGELPEGRAGNCSELGTMSNGNHDIVIDRDAWRGLSDNQRESIIFHELGHCELNRIHDNQIYSNSDWKSIMRGEPLPAKSSLVNYSGRRKTHYLDELFKPELKAPDWVGIRIEYNTIGISQKEAILVQALPAKMMVLTELDLSGDYEIEISLKKISTTPSSFAGVAWGGMDLENSFFVMLSGTNGYNISSGQNLEGPLFVYDLPENSATSQSILTIRKQGDLFYFFYNREFLYWTDVLPLETPSVGVFSEDNTHVEFNSLTVYHIIS